MQAKIKDEVKINDNLQLKFEKEVNNNKIASQQYEEMKKLLNEENLRLKNKNNNMYNLESDRKRDNS